MDKTLPPRLVAKLAIFGGIAFQTRGYRPNVYLGDPINICNVLSDQGCQEISLVFPRNPPPLDQIQRILSVSRAPTAIGGFGTDLRLVESLLGSGAEKVIVSDSLWDNPGAIESLAENFGEQAVSCSLDYRICNGERIVVKGRARAQKVGALVELLEELPTERFGEIVLSCISNDGSRAGLDLDAGRGVKTSKPLLLSGGYDGAALLGLPADGVVSATALFLFGRRAAPLTNFPQNYRMNSSV